MGKTHLIRYPQNGLVVTSMLRQITLQTLHLTDYSHSTCIYLLGSATTVYVHIEGKFEVRRRVAFLAGDRVHYSINQEEEGEESIQRKRRLDMSIQLGTVHRTKHDKHAISKFRNCS